MSGNSDNDVEGGCENIWLFGLLAILSDNDVEGGCRPYQWINAAQPGSLEGRPCLGETVNDFLQ